MSRTVRVGSRESLLAVKQAEIVMEAIRASSPELALQLVTIKTKGDKVLDQRLDKIGGKGLFIKELEQALYDGEIDIAVHSYKDMPHEETEGLPVVALSKRESPFDVLVLPKGASEMDRPKPVGSSSLRRSIQFQELYDGFEIESIRGNVLTRLDKLDRGEFSAIILAEAGLNRLGLRDRISKVFAPDEMIPSASQGVLAVQGRQGEDYAYLADFHHEESEWVADAERTFLKTLNGGCSSPVAAYAEVRDGNLTLSGMYVDEARGVFKGRMSGAIREAKALGERLALVLRQRGAKK